MRGSRRARKIFHERSASLIPAALRQHGRLIEHIALQWAGQGTGDGHALRDFGEVEEAHLDLALGDQFAAACERGMVRLALDLVGMPSLASASPAMAPEVLGFAGLP